ncbi:MAG: hypothetical protein C9356_15060 [Oleiphilus sp.]|nr:MAG: hypothetical protein C9356_15060 [Oleiphilus sp.]
MEPSAAQRKALALMHAENLVIKRLIAGYFSDVGSIMPNTLQSLVHRGWIHKRLPGQPLAAKGNGYVISPEGERILSLPEKPKRQAPALKATSKQCPGCQTEKSIDHFVTVYGYANPRGKYCRSCFDEHQRQHARELLDGRDFCPYCGVAIPKAYDYTETGRSLKTYVHRDHMDPLSLGGIDADSNTLYCCVGCNRSKADQPFTRWLASLEEPYKTISREIYVRKHGHPPEQFKPTKQAQIYEYFIRPPTH